jgi:putative inorganic carbon (hco3(-)) transporter
LKHILSNIANHRWVLGICLAFIAANFVLITHEWYLLLFFPFAILIAYLAVFSLDKLVFLTVFLVPISVPLENYVVNLGFNIQIPTEINLLLILLIVILKLFTEKPFKRSILTHPVSIAIYVNLVWLAITTCTSSMPLVSLKFLISRLWFLVAFYFLASHMFLSRKNIRLYVWLYILSFLIVVFVALSYMWTNGVWNQHAAHISARPFLPDHTSYGAILAMLLPFLIGFGIYPKYSISQKILAWLLTVILVFALLLSYTRAAWISVAVGVFCFLLIRFRIKFYFVALVSLSVFAVLYANRTAIIMEMEQNRQDSSKDLTKHLQSIYNIQSDVSNLERINRWKSAFRMFKERPIFGWGPGTYMFNYAPFQMWRDKTPISTNLGDWGNAHSEYIGPLAESGVMGTLSIIMIIVTAFYTGLKRYAKINKGLSTKILLVCAILGLVTYCTHGFLNNFLDTDKASALFWGFIAIIVAIDVKYRSIEEGSISQS